MSDTLTVEIPADVKDNSPHTVRFQWRGVVDDTLNAYDLDLARNVFKYDVYIWEDTAPDGQRVTMTRMDKDGKNQWLYGTYHFTRVACKTGCAGYAQAYVMYDNGVGNPSVKPYCGDCLCTLRKVAQHEGATLTESEPLRIGQHD